MSGNTSLSAALELAAAELAEWEQEQEPAQEAEPELELVEQGSGLERETSAKSYLRKPQRS